MKFFGIRVRNKDCLWAVGFKIILCLAAGAVTRVNSATFRGSVVELPNFLASVVVESVVVPFLPLRTEATCTFMEVGSFAAG